jgi:uncharacterized repeat protein (TIGR01451 family)
MPKSALATGQSTDCFSFAIFTTDVNGTNNENHYASKPEVYLNGGPGPSGQLPEGTVIYYRVEEPDGTPLSEIRQTTADADGQFFVQLAPFDTTTNAGNEYSVTASQREDLAKGDCTKNDNFKVDGPGTLKVTKTVEGGESDGSFPFTVDCGIAGDFAGSIGDGDSATFEVDNLAECTVTEGTLPAPPAGYTWGEPTYTGNPGTVHTDETTTIGIVNHLNLIPRPAVSIVKSVSLASDGPWVDELTVTTGTTVYYRITISNEGNVPLTDVSLVDNKFNLEECDVPSTLDVGESFDCDYSAVAETGTLVNTATVDSEETGPEDDDATVVGEAAPSLSIVKSVSTSADGPWSNQIAVQTGTPVYYQVIVTNTGNVDLTDLSLVDDTYDLPADCVPDGALAPGDSFTCAYSAVAETGTTVNTATADSAETEPEDDDATVVASPAPVLIIDKSNNAPSAGGLPTVKEGDTVTYTLDYSFSGESVANGVITDVLPAGLTYVADSATSNDEFTFDGYDATTRTLTWTAEEVTESGSVSYKATVDEGAADLAQPLTNVATVDSDDTDKDTDDSDVFVSPPPQAETSVPTPPQTDTVGSPNNSASGGSMLLILAALAAIALAVVFIAPTPTSIRKRMNR